MSFTRREYVRECLILIGIVAGFLYANRSLWYVGLVILIAWPATTILDRHDRSKRAAKKGGRDIV